MNEQEERNNKRGARDDDDNDNDNDNDDKVEWLKDRNNDKEGRLGSTTREMTVW